MSKSYVLVIGGAGYIGSHMAKVLFQKGFHVIIYDNISTGFTELAKFGQLVIGDLSNKKFLNTLFKNYNFECVMHFAASSLVSESVVQPAKYYNNNVVNTLNLLDVMIENDVNKIVFSSSAAIFGEPQYVPIDEDHPMQPINPYGASKMMVERILSDYATAYDLNFVSLRYFNACGADPKGNLGEMHKPETHLIPLALQAASGRKKNFTIFGEDYSTPDGTCIRDFVHVNDLCMAHFLAMENLTGSNLKYANYFNLGSGSGFSVRQILSEIKAVVSKEGYDFSIINKPRRIGDPAVLIADSSKVVNELGWEKTFSSLNEIIKHAWAWEKQLSSSC